MTDPAVRKRALFREVNERIRDVSRRFGFVSGTYEFFCECTHPECLLRVRVTGELYDEIVADSRRYLVAAEHEENSDLPAPKPFPPPEPCPASSASATLSRMSVEIFYCPV